jgi:hypothetical protein
MVEAVGKDALLPRHLVVEKFHFVEAAVEGGVDAEGTEHGCQ